MGGNNHRSVFNRATATWPRRAAIAAVFIGLAAFSILARRDAGPSVAEAEPVAAPATAAAPPPPANPQPGDVLAVVNSEPLTRADMHGEALYHYGSEVLESVVNKTLIADYCRLNNLVVTREQVDQEIDRVAERFMVDRNEWLRMLEKERGIAPIQYAEDIIWPTIALRMIAAGEIQPTEQDVQQAYETQFGPSVQCRLIAFADAATAEKVRELAMAAPDEFGNLAKQYSVDVNSASAKGLIQPIRRHMGDPVLEQAAFTLRKGEISAVIPVNTQFVILRCENHLPGRNVPLEGKVRTLLEDAIREKKLRLTSTQVFERLQAQSQVDMVYPKPERRAQEPGIAARINGRLLTTDVLADECAKRHGKEVLEGMIGRKLLEQALKRGNVQITQADIDGEIAHAALLMGKTTTPGGDEPDVAGWIKQVCESQQITVEQYVRDTVWPSAALKKLVVDRVQVTDEDLQKGYEANYGPRVRCRAIVLNQMRRAQEVWELARDNPSIENFGLLAEQYSIDSVSRTLRGEVPPIQKHGGQPQLEREAFSLQPGELSGIIQIGETYVILYCEGQTQPRTIDFADVRQLIHDEVYEKKLRLEMGRHYDRLQSEAHIDNFLVGTVKSPTLGKSVTEAAAAAQGRATPASYQAPAP